MHIFRNFRNYFFRGMAALLPTILTLWLFYKFYEFVQKNVSQHINHFVVRLCIFVKGNLQGVDGEELDQFRTAIEDAFIHGKWQITGFIIAFIVVTFVGAILASVVGKGMWKWFDRTLQRLPVLNRVYPYVKQITDAMFSREKIAFKRVVAIEYPRKGVWSIGMVTGNGIQGIKDKLDGKREFLTIFIPSSPTPFTGYVIMVDKEAVIDLDISIEQALRFTISGGVITPSEWEKMQEKDELV